MTSRLGAFVQRISLLGPGLPGWSAGADVLRGLQPWQPLRTVIPAPLQLSPSDRRRAGRVVRLAVSVAADAALDEAAALATVFTSSGGDGENCHALCETLATAARDVSPTRFMNSVHNAAAGYWSIAAAAHGASTALCAHDASFGAGLLEALCQLQVEQPRVLLVAYDADYPQPLHATRPVPDAFAVGLLLSRAAGSAPLARIEATLTTQQSSRLPQAELEALRSTIPAARCLPLLALLAGNTDGDCVLDYLDELRLAVKVHGC